MKRHAIAIGKYRARAAYDVHVERIIRAAFRRAVLAIIDKMGERVMRQIWEPHFRFRALMYETGCEAIATYIEALRREIDERIAGKIGEIWEPER